MHVCLEMCRHCAIIIIDKSHTNTMRSEAWKVLLTTTRSRKIIVDNFTTVTHWLREVCVNTTAGLWNRCLQRTWFHKFRFDYFKPVSYSDRFTPSSSNLNDKIPLWQKQHQEVLWVQALRQCQQYPGMSLYWMKNVWKNILPKKIQVWQNMFKRLILY